jgi:hypothetical protein
MSATVQVLLSTPTSVSSVLAEKWNTVLPFTTVAAAMTAINDWNGESRPITIRSSVPPAWKP